ncbi:MAG TPA: hypothetical protein VM261_09415 [Kofleriaceae bacterium]|nr:hypothetical protein [Kofleriaceae bacterium]
MWARSAICTLVASAALGGAAHRAQAQPGAPGDGRAMDTYRLEAREAALRGDCKRVGTIAQLVAEVDAAYYRDVFLRDTVVASCNGGVGGVQLPPSAVPPSTDGARAIIEPERPASGSPDTGRGIGGMFAGLGAGALLGFLGAFGGALIGDAAHDGGCESFCDEVVIPAIIGFQVGANVGLAAGITLVGNHKGGKGSFGTSLALGLVGSGVSWLFAMNESTIDSGAWGVAFFVLPVAGTMTGYWMTHEHVDLTIVPTGNGLAVTGRF